MSGAPAEEARDRVRLEASWKHQLDSELRAPYLLELRAFLNSELVAQRVIFPPLEKLFAALDATPFDQVRVVILGQDPYHGPGQANGMCFSVERGVEPPPSLKNIFKELQRDLAIPAPPHGNLSGWAAQGVLLLNSVLSVERFKAGSHQGRGWERFTDAVISKLNEQRSNVVYLLWGSYAQRKGGLLDRSRQCVLESVHPSPLSAHRGFIGNGHFGAANRYLESHGFAPIDWQIR